MTSVSLETLLDTVISSPDNKLSFGEQLFFLVRDPSYFERDEFIKFQEQNKRVLEVYIEILKTTFRTFGFLLKGGRAFSNLYKTPIDSPDIDIQVHILPQILKENDGTDSEYVKIANIIKGYFKEVLPSYPPLTPPEGSIFIPPTFSGADPDFRNKIGDVELLELPGSVFITLLLTGASDFRKDGLYRYLKLNITVRLKYKDGTEIQENIIELIFPTTTDPSVPRYVPEYTEFELAEHFITNAFNRIQMCQNSIEQYNQTISLLSTINNKYLLQDENNKRFMIAVNKNKIRKSIERFLHILCNSQPIVHFLFFKSYTIFYQRINELLKMKTTILFPILQEYAGNILGCTKLLEYNLKAIRLLDESFSIEKIVQLSLEGLDTFIKRRPGPSVPYALTSQRIKETIFVKQNNKSNKKLGLAEGEAAAAGGAHAIPSGRSTPELPEEIKAVLAKHKANEEEANEELIVASQEAQQKAQEGQEEALNSKNANTIITAISHRRNNAGFEPMNLKKLASQRKAEKEESKTRQSEREADNRRRKQERIDAERKRKEEEEIKAKTEANLLLKEAVAEARKKENGPEHITIKGTYFFYLEPHVTDLVDHTVTIRGVEKKVKRSDILGDVQDVFDTSFTQTGIIYLFRDSRIPAQVFDKRESLTIKFEQPYINALYFLAKTIFSKVIQISTTKIFNIQNFLDGYEKFVSSLESFMSYFLKTSPQYESLGQIYIQLNEKREEIEKQRGIYSHKKTLWDSLPEKRKRGLKEPTLDDFKKALNSAYLNFWIHYKSVLELLSNFILNYYNYPPEAKKDALPTFEVTKEKTISPLLEKFETINKGGENFLVNYDEKEVEKTFQNLGNFVQKVHSTVLARMILLMQYELEIKAGGDPKKQGPVVLFQPSPSALKSYEIETLQELLFTEHHIFPINVPLRNTLEFYESFPDVASEEFINQIKEGKVNAINTEIMFHLTKGWWRHRSAFNGPVNSKTFNTLIKRLFEFIKIIVTEGGYHAWGYPICINSKKEFESIIGQLASLEKDEDVPEFTIKYITKTKLLDLYRNFNIKQDLDPNDNLVNAIKQRAESQKKLSPINLSGGRRYLSNKNKNKIRIRKIKYKSRKLSKNHRRSTRRRS